MRPSNIHVHVFLNNAYISLHCSLPKYDNFYDNNSFFKLFITCSGQLTFYKIINVLAFEFCERYAVHSVQRPLPHLHVTFLWQWELRIIFVAPRKSRIRIRKMEHGESV